MIKRHERPRSQGDLKNAQAGGIVEKEGPINVSNVMLLDPKDNKPTRIGVRSDKGGKRVRFAKRTGNESADGGDRDTHFSGRPAAAPARALREEILPALTSKFGYSTPMEAPRLEKITLNMGLGTEKQDKRSFEAAQEQLAIIAGQHPNVRRARKSSPPSSCARGCRSASR